MSAPIGSISDAFDDGSQASIWGNAYANNGTSKTEANGVLKLSLVRTGSAAYAAYSTSSTYDLTGGRAFVRIPQMCNTASNAQGYLKLFIDASNAIQWIQEAGTLYAQKIVAGVTTTLSSVAYDSVAHRYLRIRESAGITYWDYSEDGYHWTALTSATNPIVVTGLYVELGAGTYQNEVQPGAMVFDRFNILNTGSQIAKTFVYKIFKDNEYVGDIPNVTSDFNPTQDINSAGAQLEVDFANSFDDVDAEQVDTFLVDEAGNRIIDEQGNNIVVRKEYTFNGIPIDLPNRVKVYVYDDNYPDGLLKFDGLISKWQTSYRSDSIKLILLSWGVQLANYVLSSDPTGEEVSQLIYETDYSLFADSGGKFAVVEAIAQTFTLGNQATIGSLSIWAKRPSGSGAIILSWYLAHGTPTSPGSIIDSGEVYQGAIGTGYGEVALNLGTPQSLAAGTYHLVLYNAGSLTSGWSYPIVAYTTSAPYASGSMYKTTDYWGGAAYSDLGFDLAFTVNSSSGSSALSYDNQDPGSIMRRIMDQYIGQGGIIAYDASTIEATDTNVSYDYKVATISDAIEKVYELAPDGWYWYVDLATNMIHLHQFSSQADHLLTLGKHFVDADIQYSLESVVNVVHFSGGDTGAGENLYSIYTNPSSKSTFGQWLELKSDNRVTQQATADTIGVGILNRQQEPVFETSVIINSGVYDIESFVIGQMVGFQNFDNLLDTIVYQIVRISRIDAENVRLQLGNIPPRSSSALEQVQRKLHALDTINNSDTPS